MKGNEYFIYISILQNGYPIAETKSPLSKKRTFTLTNNEKGDLSLPLYPLSEPITIAKVKKNKVLLNIDQPWNGYLTIGNLVTYLKPMDRSKRTFEMALNDYANITLNDLRVMIKIMPKPKKDRVRKDSQYNPKFIDKVFQNKYEKSALFAGVLFAALVIVPIISLLSQLTINRPQSFEELESEFTLPFIHKDSLVTAPEAMQRFLYRPELIKSTVLYYRNLMNTFFNLPNDDKKVLFPTTYQTYEKFHNENNSIVQEKIDQQKQMNKQITSYNHSKIIEIPSVVGESFQQNILKVIKKIELIHKVHKYSLEERRKVTNQFNNDPEYKWGSYKTNDNKISLVNVKKNTDSQKIEKIAVFSQKTNEETMYQTSATLGTRAELLNNYLHARTSKKQSLSRENIDSIFIPTDSIFFSFIPGTNPHEEDSNIPSLAFGESGDKAAEPIIGEVHPNKIKHVFLKNRYQINLCYDAALRQNKKTSGNMHWSVLISSTGTVSEINLVKTSIRDPQLIRCVKEKMAQWIFPKPKTGSIKVKQVLNFSKKDQKIY